MTSDLLTRLESWRECVRTGKPAWLAEGAPRIVAELEAELRATFGPEPIIPLTPFEEEIAQRIEAETDETPAAAVQPERREPGPKGCAQRSSVR